MYKESYYNFKCNFEDGNMMLYNSKTGAVAVIEKEHVKEISDVLETQIDSKFTGVLYTQGFLTDDSEDELAYIRRRYDNVHSSQKTIKVVMMPAEFCNLACPYCFIYNYRNKIMRQEVFDNVVSYIEKKLKDADEKRTVLISWYGGEPLLMKNQIIAFMDLLRGRLHSRAELKGSIITNGYYLDFDVFSKLYENKVTTFQITFDGDQEFHDTTRMLKDGRGGTFDVLINNIKTIKQQASEDMKFDFLIRINFMKNTYTSVYGLIDKLNSIIGGDRRFFIYVRPVYNYHTCRPDNNEITDDVFSIREGLKVQTELSLYIQKISESYNPVMSLQNYLPMPATRWCSEDGEASIIVGYDGSIYFCDTMVGDEKFCVGHLEADGTISITEEDNRWRTSVFEMDNIGKCLKCKCLPTCMGGCKRERIYLKNPTPCLYNESDILEFMRTFYENEYCNTTCQV